MTANLENYIPQGSTGPTGPIGPIGPTGAALDTKQLTLIPRSLAHGYWQPGQGSGLVVGTSSVGAGFNAPTNAESGSGTTYVEGIDSNGPFLNVIASGSGFATWSQTSDALIDTTALPRFIYRLSQSIAGLSSGPINAQATIYVGLTDGTTATPVDSDYTSATEAIWIETTGAYSTLSNWVIKRRVGGVSQADSDTGVTPTNGADPVYVVFDFTSSTDVTVTLYDSSFSSLYSSSFSGASEVPSPTTTLALLVRSGDAFSKNLYFYGAMLDYGG